VSNVLCCKCGVEYPLKLYEAVGAKLPVTQCPNCGVVHTAKFDIEDLQPGKPLDLLKLLNYYYSELSSDGTYSGAVGSDASPPVKQASPGGDVTGWDRASYFWVGIAASEIGCNKTVNTSQNLYLRYRIDGGAWTDLGTGTLVPSGTGNMQYTDLSPPNADAWVAQNNSCGDGLEPGDQVAQDNSNVLAAGTGTGNYTKEFLSIIHISEPTRPY